MIVSERGNCLDDMGEEGICGKLGGFDVMICLT